MNTANGHKVNVPNRRINHINRLIATYDAMNETANPIPSSSNSGNDSDGDASTRTNEATGSDSDHRR